ncbi:MAG: S8 family serine peptidase [Phycisphaerales bacterium]
MRRTNRCIVGCALVLASNGIAFGAPGQHGEPSLTDPLGAAAPKATAGPAAKIESSVRRLQARVRQSAGRTPLATLSEARAWNVRGDGAIQVYLEVSDAGPATVAAVQALGIQPERVVPSMKVIQAWLTPNQIDLATSLPFVRLVRLPGYAEPREGAVTTEGDAAHRADQLRTAPYCLDGDGVRVGIISDGIDHIFDATLSGDIPTKPGKKFTPDVTVAAGLNGSGDEGTAMLEIVYDLAPKAKLFFAGPSTSAEMVDAINALAEDSACHVICDDLGFFDQPMFDDGPIADAAESAVVGAGRTYVSAAGNDADAHWQDDFAGVVVNNAATDGNNWELMDFDGAGDHSLDVTVPGNGRLRIHLQWDDKFRQSSNDYDLYVVNAAETVIFGSSTNLQNGTQNPREFISLNNNGAAPVSAKIWIRNFNAAGPSTMEMFVLDSPMNEYVVPGDSIFGHPAVEEVISVGAVDAANAPCGLEDFSSQGPSTVSFPFEERDTPTVVATDRVHVTGAGCFACDPASCPPTPAGGCVFSGTSAAAPHIAGIVAQILELNPDATPGEVRTALITSVTDCGELGYDHQFGYGFVDAPEAADALDHAQYSCPADFDDDGSVNAVDLGILLGAWGDFACFVNPPCRPDLNCDGTIDAADLAILLTAWGPCAP